MIRSYQKILIFLAIFAIFIGNCLGRNERDGSQIDYLSSDGRPPVDQSTSAPSIAPEAREMIDRLIFVYRNPVEMLVDKQIYKIYKIEPRVDDLGRVVKDFPLIRKGWRISFGERRQASAGAVNYHHEIDIDSQVECIDSEWLEKYVGIEIQKRSRGGHTGKGLEATFENRHKPGQRFLAKGVEAGSEKPKYLATYYSGCVVDLTILFSN